MSKLHLIKDYLKNKFSSGNEFSSLYNSGVDAYDRKDYDKAVKYFEEAAKQEDLKPQVYYNLALSYHSIKNYDKAICLYNKFLEIIPNDYEGLYNLGLVYYTKQNFSEAVKLFEKCVEIKEDKDSIESLILVYLSNNEIGKAIEFCEKLPEKSENGITLYYHAAKVFEHKNALSKDFTYIDVAIQMYSRIINEKPNFFDAYLAKSICYARKGDWENSVEFCKKALEANPKSYEANNQMGLVYYCCNEVQKAVNYYEEALKLKPQGDYKIYSNLAYAYEKIGHYDRAINLFDKLVHKFPQCPAKDEIKNHLRILKTL